MVEEINEIAIIFKRKKSEYELVQEFVPYKVVEGYYYENEDCFIDSEGNVYSHMASITEVGNVFAGRRSIYDTLKLNPHRSLPSINRIILNTAKIFEYYKNVDESSDEYNIIKIKNKEKGTISNFTDKDTAIYYELYNEIKQSHMGDNNVVNEKKDNIITPDNKENEEIKGYYETPLELINNIKKTIKGQDEAIEAIVTLIWMKYQYPNIPKSNILMLGPSGVGKTAIFKKIKELLNIPLVIYGITGTSQSGYKGHDIEEMLTSLYYESDENIAKAQNGIVLIDEFDKIATNRETGEIGTIAVQNELLKLIEGCERTISIDGHNSFNIDTSNITFVCCGAFSDLFTEHKEKVIGFNKYPEEKVKNKIITTEDIINYGIIRELVGRLPIIIELNDLNNNKEVLKDILLNSDESLFTMLVNALKIEGVEIENLDEFIDLIIDNAISKKIGVRGLISPIRNMFLKIFYEVSNNKGKYNKVILGQNIINDNRDFILVPKKVKKKVKTDSLMII